MPASNVLTVLASFLPAELVGLGPEPLPLLDSATIATPTTMTAIRTIPTSVIVRRWRWA